MTHNSTVGASVEADYILYTAKEVVDGKPTYRVFSGYPTDKRLVSVDGEEVNSHETLLNSLEAGLDLTKGGNSHMKLLKIAENVGEFQAEDGQYRTVDKIAKEDLLRLVDLTLVEDDVEFDPYDEKSLKNQAHQVIYKSVLQKLQDLRSRRREFVDESARLFLEDYQRYREQP